MKRRVTGLLMCGLALLTVAAAPPMGPPSGRGNPAPAASAAADQPARPPGTARPPSPPATHGASPVAAPVTAPTAGSTPAPEAVPVIVFAGAQAAAIGTAPLGPSVAGLVLLVVGGLVLVHRVRRKR